MKRACASLLAGVLLVIAMHEPARSEERADSSIVHRWSVVYRSRIDIDRTSQRFPWKDEEAFSNLNDRLAVLGEISWRDRLSFFAKGATGVRLRGDYQDQQFILDQAHVGFDLFGGALKGRLYSRERVYRTDQRLLKLLSDESAIVGIGEGLALEVNAGAHVALNYVESVLRPDFAVRGGLPSFRSADSYLRVVRLEAFQKRIAHAGFTLSEIRTFESSDRVTVGTDLGFTVRGVDFLAELARTQRGGWEELRAHSLFDLNWRGARLDRFSALFSDEDAFAAEIEGLRVGMGAFGVAGLVPGYRYYGWAYDANPVGEGARFVRERYALAWWKPVSYDAMVSIDVSSGTSYGRDFSRLIGKVRMRYKGGFELGESILCASGERISAAVTLIDDNDLSRIVMTARIDDLGAGDVLSYLAQGTLNLGSRVAAKSALFLYQSRTSLYNVEIEFRPREKFLFRAAIGSFTPQYEGLMLDNAFEREIYPPSKERFILFFARVWFGGGGAK